MLIATARPAAGTRRWFWICAVERVAPRIAPGPGDRVEGAMVWRLQAVTTSANAVLDGPTTAASRRRQPIPSALLVVLRRP